MITIIKKNKERGEIGNHDNNQGVEYRERDKEETMITIIK